MSVKDYAPVGSISTQLTQQHLKKLRQQAKPRPGHKTRPPRGAKAPDLQQMAREAANQSLGISRPGRISGDNLEQAARKAAGASVRGWR